MTETPDPESGTVWDAPNQQVVRPDASHPADEGDGGSEHPEAAPQDGEAEAKRPAARDTAPPAGPNLDDMTKDELLGEAERRGVEADESMTKAEIREAIGE